MESSVSTEEVIETLTKRGWCFGKIEEVKAVIMINSALHDEGCTVDFVESELANMDLRSFGAKSLPDQSLLRKSSYIHAPKVLQISAARDISQSSIADSSGNSSSRRLLRLNLTDGCTEITAIEYCPVPAIPNNVVPGTKVRLEKKAAIHNGIICLDPRVITVLGGVVKSLYEEWQMNQKYSGFSRSSLRVSQESGTGGPPPFEKLKIGGSSHWSSEQGRISCQHSKPFPHYHSFLGAGSTFKNTRPVVAETSGSSETRPVGRHQNLHLKAENTKDDLKAASIVEKTEEKPSNSETRPKEVAEAAPVQNQAAAQKLLQKMNNPNRGDWHSRGQKHRGKGKQEEAVYTLKEWERRTAGPKTSMKDEPTYVSQDEHLAWQLQNQFDLEDNVPRNTHQAEAENIRMSMFNFERGEDRNQGTTDHRGRGRGRGGKGRGKGRGRGRF